MNIVTIIHARRSSTRLPDKVMMPLAGKPLLVRMVERVQHSRLKGTVVVATSTEPSDDIIEKLCKENNIAVFRGSLNDLLDRHYRAAKQFNADVVLKIPSDVPLIDPEVIDRVISFFLQNRDKFDYVSNLHPATYPDGNDVEVMTITALENARKNAVKDFEREHTTPYFWENPAKFRIGNYEWESGKDFSMSHRFTIDYKEDYDFIKRVYDELYTTNPQFGLDDILNLLREEPEIFEINSKYAGVNWYRNHLNELKTVTAEQTRFET
jgi:spore coat polysaccharide biosynthesis protein SpsF